MQITNPLSFAVVLSYESAMGDLISTLKENWAVIADAPLAFAIWTLILLAIIWAIVTWAKANQVGDLESRITLRDDRIAEYERKLDGASPQQAHERIERLEGRIAQMEADRFAALKNADGCIDFDGGNAAQGSRPARATDAALEAKLAHRRKVIADGRKLVAGCNRYRGDKDLVTLLNCYEEWPAIRAHIDKDILDRIEKERIFVVPADGSSDGKLSLIRSELDRLEREWDLA